MKRIFTIILMVQSLLLAPIAHAQTYWSGTADKEFAGMGTEADPYLITTAEELAGLAARVNDTVNREDFAGKYFKLTNDLYLTDFTNPDTTKWHEWDPIGKWIDIPDPEDQFIHKYDTCWFRGNFDGANHTIHNVYMGTVGEISFGGADDPTAGDVVDFSGNTNSFFSFVDNASISNLTLNNLGLLAMGKMGGMVSCASNTKFKNCHVTHSTLIQDTYKPGALGGLVGEVTNCVIEDCSATDNIFQSSTAGGLVGTAYNTTIRNSHASSTMYLLSVHSNSKEILGRGSGFVLNSEKGSVIENCHADIVSRGGTLKKEYNAGYGVGFVSVNHGVIRCCSATGQVKAFECTAGFCMTNRGRIESCYTSVNGIYTSIEGKASSFVSNNGDSQIDYGLLLEDAPGTIINCFAVGHYSLPNGTGIQGTYGFMFYQNNTSEYDNGSYSHAIGCYYNNDSVPALPSYSAKGTGGAHGYSGQYMQSQAFVDTLNMVAAFYGTSTWEYREGQYPIPTGMKATNITDYVEGGSGTKDNPFLINTKKHLENFRAMVDHGADFENMFIKQTADIELNAPFEQWGTQMPEQWTPIADTRFMPKLNEYYEYTFLGTYDGDFHEVRNMYIENMKNDQAFFHTIGKGARIKNLGVTNAYIKQDGSVYSAAILLATFPRYAKDMIISQCWTSGTVDYYGASANYFGAGAMIGNLPLEGTANILNCYSSASVTSHEISFAAAPTLTRVGVGATNDTVANYLFMGTLQANAVKGGTTIPSAGKAINYNAYYDVDVFPKPGTLEQQYAYGARSTAQMQTKEFVNDLNNYVDEWNMTHDYKLDYWEWREGEYPKPRPNHKPAVMVKFESNGGSFVAAKRIYENSYLTCPKCPTKEGQIFAGWYADTAFTQVFDFDSTLIKQDITLYAKWLQPTMHEYDITPFQNKFTTEYHIQNKAQLIGFMRVVNGIEGVQAANSLSGKTVYLDCDIMLNDTTDWEYWGRYVYAESWEPITTFLGTFDGQGHTISGLYIHGQADKDYTNTGLFGVVGIPGEEANAKICNVGIKASVFDLREITKRGDQIGLLAGNFLDGSASQCFAHGKIVGNNIYYYIGGLIGLLGGQKGIQYGEAIVTDCYARVDIISTSQGVLGGIVGRNERAALNNSFATGRGWRYGASNGNIANVYYDKQSNTTALQNSGTGLSTNEMHAKSTFVGYDFENIWGRNDTINDGYPYLRCFYTEHIPDSPDPTKVTGIELQETSLSVVAGAKIQLHANVLPADAPEKGIIWSIRNDVSGMAEVDENGKVTTHYLSSYAGQTKKAYVTATTLEGNYQKTCTLSISYPSLAVAATKQHRRVGTTAWSAWNTNESTKKSVNWEYLVAIYLNPDSLHQTITYTNSNPDVASFEIISHDTIIPNFNSSSGAPIRCALGVLTCQVAGSTTITATHSEGYTKSTSFTIAQYSINGISISMPNATIYPGDTVQLKANTNPTYASDKPESYTWSSGNESIFEVNELGQLIAKKPGTTTVKLTSTNPSYSTSKSVTVASVPATSITIIPSEITIGVGDTTRLSVVFEPLNATEKDFSWSSDNTRYATISRIAGSTDGLLKGVKVGSATIRATTPSTLTTASLSASCKVTIVEKYSVRFYDWDGTLLKSQRVLKGSAATAPADPVREGYTFIGWDKDFSNVQSDLTVTALYEQNAPDPIYYTVIFQDWDGSILKNEQVEQGKSATAPADPVREGYTFVGWDKDFSNVQSDLTVTAQYEQNAPEPIYYTVTFQDWDGTTLKTEQVEQGKSATAPATPVREGYTFKGWDKDFSNVQSDLTVTAQYEKNVPEPIYYTVTFQDWDGSILKNEQVEQGKSATAPAAPVREGYTFIGWDKDFSNVQSDLTVTALYEQNAQNDAITVRLNPSSAPTWSNVYLYSWYDGGAVQPCGAWPGLQVSKDSNGWWSYTFDSNVKSVNIIWNNGTGEQTIDITDVTQSTCYDLDTDVYPYGVFVIDCSKNPTALEDVQSNSTPKAHKVIKNNTLYIILPDGTKYSATGQKL